MISSSTLPICRSEICSGTRVVIMAQVKAKINVFKTPNFLMKCNFLKGKTGRVYKPNKIIVMIIFVNIKCNFDIQ